jgi:hypothetical protein
MTILEALQSLTEYENTNLFSKVLADNGLVSTDTYVSSSHKDKIDAAKADLYEAMAGLPEFRDGNSSTKWNSTMLISEARMIRNRLGIRTPKITGKAIW